MSMQRFVSMLKHKYKIVWQNHSKLFPYFLELSCDLIVMMGGGGSEGVGAGVWWDNVSALRSPAGFEINFTFDVVHLEKLPSGV